MRQGCIARDKTRLARPGNGHDDVAASIRRSAAWNSAALWNFRQ
jgi:hypothetical protein